MSKADVSAGRAFVSLFVKSSITKDLQKAAGELNNFGSSIVGIGAKVAGMGLAITGSLTAAVMHFATVGSELNDMSARTGIGTTALAELGHAAGMTGASMGAVESALGKMQKNLGEIGPESAKVREALSQIGLSAEQLATMSPEDQFQTIAESIGAIEDPTKQAATAMAVFGSSGKELLPMMENIKELRAEARELGIAPSPESIAAADAVGDAIDRMKAVISSAVFEIGAALAPMALDIMEALTLAAKTVRKFVVENKSLIVTAAKVGAALLVAGSAIVAIGSVFIGAGMAISGLLATLSLVGGAIGVIGSIFAVVLSPVGLLVAALVAGAYAWARFTEAGQSAVTGLVSTVTSTFGGMLTTVTDTMGGIMDAIRAGDLSLAGQIAMVGLRLIFAQGMDAIHKLFGDGWGTMISQVLSGDFAKAFATLGATLLESWAGITQGLVGLFTGAANAIAAKWAETVNAISDYILEAASSGGMMGWALEQVSGVNAQEEVARGKRIEAERIAKGMKPDGGGMIKSNEFNITDETKKNIADLTASIDAKMAALTAGADQALDEVVAGQAGAVSESIAKLRAELAALKAEAAGKVAAINSGKAEEAAGGGGGGGGSEVGMKGSAGTFSLQELASSAGQGVAQKQLSVAQQQKVLQEKTLALGEQQLLAMMGLGATHP